VSAPRATAGPLAGVYPGTLDCVHCGLCLSSCPTYRATGREISSPRGRVYLMRGVAEGRLPLDALTEEAYLCLGCRACETACPSGVAFGRLLEETRAEIEAAGLRRGLGKRIESFALRRVVPRRRTLRAAVSLFALAQRLRLDRLVLPLLPRSLREAHALAPAVPPRAARRRLRDFIAGSPPVRGRVALFEGCLMPELFGAVNAATARVLAREGFDVVVPRGQGCCGALQAHAGDAGFARELAATNVAALASGEFDALIVNSAGCGAALREYGHWLGTAGRGLAGRVRDICEFLDGVAPRAPLAPLAGTLCYDDPCHLVHGQRVEAAPRRLLARIPELRLVPHREASACCGAAGIYNLTHREMSGQVLARKLDALAEVDPDWIATGNPGCLMQLGTGARGRGLRAEVLHPIELVDRSQGTSRGAASSRSEENPPPGAYRV
jgi:glycolate oxidase iron-sulfur subunit